MHMCAWLCAPNVYVCVVCVHAWYACVRACLCTKCTICPGCAAGEYLSGFGTSRTKTVLTFNGSDAAYDAVAHFDFECAKGGAWQLWQRGAYGSYYWPQDLHWFSPTERDYDHTASHGVGIDSGIGFTGLYVTYAPPVCCFCVFSSPAGCAAEDLPLLVSSSPLPPRHVDGGLF